MTIDDLETIEEEKSEDPKERSLDELLEMDSYADMSDEEIERVIAFRETIAAKAALADKMLQQIQHRTEQMHEADQAAKERAEAALADALSVSVQFKTV